MKEYLSKKYIKYIGSLCAVWAALWNVFLLGVSLEKSGPAADSTLLQCILGSENYAHDFFTRQFWFISVFVFYMAVYFVVFLFLQHESGKYRSMKLHRYGKMGYLKHCESKVLHGSLYAVLLVAAGLAGIVLFGYITGAVIRTGNEDMIGGAAASKDIFVHGFIRKNYGISNIREKQRFCGIFYACGFICTSGGRGVYTKNTFFNVYRCGGKPVRYFNINCVEYGNRTCCEKKDKNNGFVLRQK